MKKYLLTLLVSIVSVCSVVAQVPPPPDYEENSGPGSPSGPLPVDQYVFFLMGLAIIAGAYIIYYKKKKIA